MAPLYHAAAYAALERELVDWGESEAGTDHFPVRFAPGLPRPDIWTLEGTRPIGYRVGVHRDRVDAVYTWHLPAGSAVARRLRRDYDLVREEGRGGSISGEEPVALAARRTALLAIDRSPARKPSRLALR